MYIIRFRDQDLNITEICVGDASSLRTVVTLLEKNKYLFKVSHSGGYLKQEVFGWGGFGNWRSNVEDWN